MLTGNVLITGGSGTLGHAILLRAERERWNSTFTIYARSESRQAAMRRRFPHARYVLGDVRDADRLAAAMAGHETVIHAAAMKRIPECEAQPSECYATNVQGSLNVLHAAHIAGVHRVVGISTDKACRAVTAYGASKLAMEKAFQAAEGPICTLVRYGNVVASTGSVIPLWRGQAAAGQSLTLTDPTMTRFWMAPSDAVNLIVQAMGYQHGVVLVPKMHALAIAELAAIVAPNAPHEVRGLRSVEKLHEDLVHVDESAVDGPRHYLIAPGLHAETGHAYRSDTAPRLSADAFRAMLAEAEELERL